MGERGEKSKYRQIISYFDTKRDRNKPLFERRKNVSIYEYGEDGAYVIVGYGNKVLKVPVRYELPELGENPYNQDLIFPPYIVLDNDVYNLYEFKDRELGYHFYDEG